MNTVRAALPPIAGSRAPRTRQATSITVGSSAAESSALTGGGASECASGSQLCTGAQPILAASPTRMSTKATTAVPCGTPLTSPGMRAQSSDAKRAWWGEETNRMTMPSSATVSPTVVSTRYFQPASRALALPLCTTSRADAAVVASTSSQATPRLPTSGIASSSAQNRYSPR